MPLKIRWIAEITESIAATEQRSLLLMTPFFLRFLAKKDSSAITAGIAIPPMGPNSPRSVFRTISPSEPVLPLNSTQVRAYTDMMSITIPMNSRLTELARLSFLGLAMLFDDGRFFFLAVEFMRTSSFLAGKTCSKLWIETRSNDDLVIRAFSGVQILIYRDV